MDRKDAELHVPEERPDQHTLRRLAGVRDPCPAAEADVLSRQRNCQDDN
jgi:hypothetical protein